MNRTLGVPMGEAKRRKMLDQDYGRPKQPDIMDSDRIFTVLTNIGGDCMYRCLEVAQRLPGAIVQAGQVFFWDNEVHYYDCVFTYHAWIIANGQLYDCHCQLNYVFNAYRFKGLNPARMTARVGTLDNDSGLTQSNARTTDAVYVPGLALSPRQPLDPLSAGAILQTRQNGFVDTAWARSNWQRFVAAGLELEG